MPLQIYNELKITFAKSITHTALSGKDYEKI